MRKAEPPKDHPRCPICQHDERDGIEVVGMMAASNFRVAAERINNTFGTRFTAKQVQRHLQTHPLHARTAEDFGEVYDSLLDESQPMVTPANVLRTLLVQGMLDVAKGRIRVTNVQQLLQVLTTYQNLKRQELLDLLTEDGDAELVKHEDVLGLISKSVQCIAVLGYVGYNYPWVNAHLSKKLSEKSYFDSVFELAFIEKYHTNHNGQWDNPYYLYASYTWIPVSTSYFTTSCSTSYSNSYYTSDCIYFIRKVMYNGTGKLQIVDNINNKFDSSNVVFELPGDASEQPVDWLMFGYIPCKTTQGTATIYSYPIYDNSTYAK